MVATQILLTAGLCLLDLVAAHPHPVSEPSLLLERSIKAKRCASEIGAMKSKRHAIRKRNAEIKKRGLRPGIDDVDTTVTIHSQAPHFDFIRNESCVLTPEVTQGPYWYPDSQLLTQNMAQNQAGVPLELDIGVIDVHTCLPIEGALVSLWHCNATGSYSSYTGRDPNTPCEELLTENGIDDPSNFSDFRFLHTDSTTWLRGMWPTDVHGVTAFSTIFPGFYIERSIHIHAQVHTDWNVTMNGTIAHSRVVETGQIFFDETLEAEIMALEPYVSHTEIERLKNSGDSIYAQALESAAMSVADAVPMDGVDFKNGVVGYITLAIDTTTIKNGTTASPTGETSNSTTSAA